MIVYIVKKSVPKKIIHNNIRFYSIKNNNNEERNDGYMRRRLEQLAEDAFPSSVDPKAGMIKDALPYNKIELHKRLNEIENDPSNFENKYQQAIGISTIPKGASKQVRDIAMSKPWNGIESHYDSSLRMLNDSIKPIKIKNKNKINSNNTIITPPTSIRDRIHNAREGALDYKLSKISDKNIKSKKDNVNNNNNDDDDDDGWSEMYKERLLGPSMLLNDSFASVDNSIKSLADQKIMEAQKRGDFKNIQRGKPLEKGYGSLENRFIDRTEYHLNQILKKQGALPPWIEKQGGCDLRILRFKEDLDKEWLKWSLNAIKDQNPSLNNEQLINKMKILSENELKEDNKSLIKLRSKKWLDTRGEYWKSQLRELNDVIRGYNLQAPLASQKLYLLLDKELNSCYKRVAPLLVNALKKHILGTDKQGEEQNLNSKAFHSYNNLPQKENIYQSETEPLSSMFKKLFW